MPSDDFTGKANSADIGTNWTPVSNNCQIVSGSVRGGVTNVCTEYWNATTPGADQWAEITIGIGSTDTNHGSCPAVRMATSGQTFYYLWATSTQLEVWKVVSGTFTLLSGNTTACGSGDVMRLEVEGTTLRAYRNGSLSITTSDTAISSGRYGIFIYAGSSTNNTSLTIWQAGEGFAAAAGYPWPYYTQMITA